MNDDFDGDGANRIDDAYGKNVDGEFAIDGFGSHGVNHIDGNCGEVVDGRRVTMTSAAMGPTTTITRTERKWTAMHDA